MKNVVAFPVTSTLFPRMCGRAHVHLSLLRNVLGNEGGMNDKSVYIPFYFCKTWALKLFDKIYITQVISYIAGFAT